MAKKKGRPKMTLTQHLGYDPDATTYEECKEIVTQVYEKLGPSVAMYVLNKCGVINLSKLDRREYKRFVSICRSKLQGE